MIGQYSAPVPALAKLFEARHGHKSRFRLEGSLGIHESQENVITCGCAFSGVQDSRKLSIEFGDASTFPALDSAKKFRAHMHRYQTNFNDSQRLLIVDIWSFGS